MQAFHLLGSAPFYTNSFLLLTKAGHAVIIDPAAGCRSTIRSCGTTAPC